MRANRHGAWPYVTATLRSCARRPPTPRLARTGLNPGRTDSLAGEESRAIRMGWDDLIYRETAATSHSDTSAWSRAPGVTPTVVTPQHASSNPARSQ